MVVTSLTVNVWRKPVHDAGKPGLMSLHVTSGREEKIYLSVIY